LLIVRGVEPMSFRLKFTTVGAPGVWVMLAFSVVSGVWLIDSENCTLPAKAGTGVLASPLHSTPVL
jgi:hypothetical protein